MRLYLDANVVIYAIEGDSHLRTCARAWIDAAYDAQVEFFTSLFTEFECHVGCLRSGNFELTDRYSAFMRQPSWTLTPVSFHVLRRAAALRAEHSLKPPDAIHAASHLEGRCDIFLTNDQGRFKRVLGLRIADLTSPPDF